jgi:hypothetical protein
VTKIVNDLAGGVGNERINTDGRIADAGGVSK